jgi:gluconolactonase
MDGGNPDIIETKVFATLPDSLRANVADPRRGDAKRNSLEGPSFDRDGNLWCVDTRLGRLHRISPSGKWELAFEYDGMPNGLKIHRDGRIFIADRRNGLVMHDPSKGTVETLVSGPAPGESFKGLNDLVIHSSGDICFTDQGRTGLQDPTGRVFRYTVAGELQCLIGNAPSPNGLVFDRREQALFVAVTRANAVWRIATADPTERNRTGLFVQLPSAGPDGLALDEKGNLAVAHPTAGVIRLYNRYAEPLVIAKTCGGRMTANIAYGGEDNCSLFITEQETSSILVCRMPVPGRLMHSHS